MEKVVVEDVINPDFNILLVNKYDIIEMLKEEQIVRYSRPIQELYTDQYYRMMNENAGRLNIELEIQKYILSKFGYSTTQNSIDDYHKIPSTYFHDEEVKKSIFYINLNIFKYPDVHVGDDIVNTQLINYQIKEFVNLVNLQINDRPLVILAGSMT